MSSWTSSTLPKASLRTRHTTPNSMDGIRHKKLHYLLMASEFAFVKQRTTFSRQHHCPNIAVTGTAISSPEEVAGQELTEPKPSSHFHLGARRAPCTLREGSRVLGPARAASRALLAPLCVSAPHITNQLMAEGHLPSWEHCPALSIQTRSKAGEKGPRAARPGSAGTAMGPISV